MKKLRLKTSLGRRLRGTGDETRVEGEGRAPETAPRARRSPLAEYVASAGRSERARPVGRWNVWELEQAMAAQEERDEERDYERSQLLFYLRDYADPDGQLPPEFDRLVQESFGDIVGEPAR